MPRPENHPDSCWNFACDRPKTAEEFTVATGYEPSGAWLKYLDTETAPEEAVTDGMTTDAVEQVAPTPSKELQSYISTGQRGRQRLSLRDDLFNDDLTPLASLLHGCLEGFLYHKPYVAQTALMERLHATKPRIRAATLELELDESVAVTRFKRHAGQVLADQYRMTGKRKGDVWTAATYAELDLLDTATERKLWLVMLRSQWKHGLCWLSSSELARQTGKGVTADAVLKICRKWVKSGRLELAREGKPKVYRVLGSSIYGPDDRRFWRRANQPTAPTVKGANQPTAPLSETSNQPTAPTLLLQPSTSTALTSEVRAGSTKSQVQKRKERRSGWTVPTDLPRGIALVSLLQSRRVKKDMDTLFTVWSERQNYLPLSERQKAYLGDEIHAGIVRLAAKNAGVLAAPRKAVRAVVLGCHPNRMPDDRRLKMESLRSPTQNDTASPLTEGLGSLLRGVEGEDA